MIAKQLKELANEWNLTVDKKQAWGVKDGYMLSMEDSAGAKLLCISFAPLNDEQRGRLERFIQEVKDQYKIKNYLLSESRLSVVIKDGAMSGKVGAQRVSEFVEKLIPVLKETNVHGISHCSVCGQPLSHEDEVHILRVDSTVLVAHSACSEGLNSSIATSQEAFHSERKNYGLGFIGALLGGLIATIPWIIVQNLGYFASILGLIIGWGAYKGYQIFKGRDGKATIWIIIFVVIVSVAFSQMTALTLAMMEYDIPINLFNYQILLSDSELFGEMLGDFGIGLLMAGLGVSNIVRRIYRSGKGNMPNIEVLSTLSQNQAV